ncbi:plasmid mobilization relaxosome protein MobC [Streptomyces sp. NPDC006704]|uniref:plasmid mobilization protein n=1 Tax=Streptomyces sp. NPDC006704 TaxID=3364760 RepID=UPI003681727E
MTKSTTSPAPTPGEPETNSLSGGASYRPSYSSPSGKVAWPSPAPGVAGADQHRGAQVGQAATEGGSQPGGETPPRSQRARTPEKRKRSPLKRERKRSRMCNVRLNDDEWTRLHTAARAARTSLPAYLVRAGLAAAEDSENTAAAVASRRELIAELFAARRHLGQVGNNLNQATRALNSGAWPAELDAVLAATQRAVQRVQAATDQLLQQN